MSEYYSTNSDSSSGQRVIDSRPQTSSARPGPQNAVIVKAKGVRDHAPETQYVRNQRSRWDKGDKSDLDFTQGELLFSYDAPASVASSFSASATEAAETKVFSSLNGMPKETKITVAGVAVTAFVAGRMIDSPVVGLQRSGFRVITNTGPYIIRVGEMVLARAPPEGHGYRYRSTSHSKIVMETVPLRLEYNEFCLPLQDAMDPMDLIEDGNIDNVLNLLKNNRVADELIGIVNGNSPVDIAAFGQALSVDVYQLRTLIERHQINIKQHVHCATKDVISEGYCLGYFFFFWIRQNLTRLANKPVEAERLLFAHQQQFHSFVHLKRANDYKRLIVGMAVATSLPRGDLPILLARIHL